MAEEPTIDDLLRKLQSVLNAEKSDAFDLAQKGLDCIEMLDFEAGSELLQQAFELDQETAYVGIAAKYLSKNDFESAKKVFKRGIEKKPDNYLMGAFFGICYIIHSLYENLDDLKEAEKGLKKIFHLSDLQNQEMDEYELLIFRCAGKCYFELGMRLEGEEKKKKLELAEAIFQKIISSNNSDVLASDYFLLANCYGEQGKIKELIICLKKTFELDTKLRDLFAENYIKKLKSISQSEQQSRP